MCSHVFTEALFTVAEKWKQPEWPSTDEQIKKKWCLHKIWYAIKYDSAIKRKNEILPSAITWMNLEGIMLSETHQAEKDKYQYNFLHVESKKSNK